MCEDPINEKYQQWVQTELVWLCKNTSKIDNIRIFAGDGILSSEDDKEIRDHCGSDEAKFSIFYEKVKKAGFSKINVLIRALRENDQENVAEEFERFKNNAGASETDGLGLFSKGKKDFIDFTQGKPLEVKVTKRTTQIIEKKGTYKIRSNPNGLALIISNENYWDKNLNREGGDIDRNMMSTLLRKFGYEVHTAIDVKYCQLADVISEFKRRLISRQVDSCVVVIMGHGQCNKLFMSDHERTLVNIYTDIIYKFDNTQCPEFYEKPKIFIVQTCQNFEVVNPRLGTDSIIPLASDILVCFSTIPGYEAYRHTQLGSLYINCLVKVFMQDAHNTKITKMLKKVGTEITKVNMGENRKQVPCYQNILFRDFFFNL